MSDWNTGQAALDQEAPAIIMIRYWLENGEVKETGKKRQWVNVLLRHRVQKKKRGGKSGLTQKSRLDDCTDNEESLGG